MDTLPDATCMPMHAAEAPPKGEKYTYEFSRATSPDHS
jgi:hypothetical protein